MQALAAYCKLSKLGKTWFKNYIPITEKRLFKLIKNFYPEIYKIFKNLIKKIIKGRELFYPPLIKYYF